MTQIQPHTCYSASQLPSREDTQLQSWGVSGVVFKSFPPQLPFLYYFYYLINYIHLFIYYLLVLFDYFIIIIIIIVVVVTDVIIYLFIFVIA